MGLTVDLHESSVRCLACPAAYRESILAVGYIITLDVDPPWYGSSAVGKIDDYLLFLALDMRFHLHVASARYRFRRQPLETCKLVPISPFGHWLAFVVSNVDCSKVCVSVEFS